MLAMKSNQVALSRIKVMSEEEKEGVDPYLRRILFYRKSGLSLNHIIGCSLDCGYCVRHFWGNFDMKTPQMLCSDDEAIQMLLTSHYFIPHQTPIQLFNSATDPFLPTVKPHTFYILKELDNLGLTNMILVITRYKVTEEDMQVLESLKNIKLTLLFTYSGLQDTRIEPIAGTDITVNSIKVASRCRQRTKIILYWRPIVPGWNDDDETMRSVLALGELVDAIVFTGYYHRPENEKYLTGVGVELPYDKVHRRKFLPKELDRKVIRLHKESGIATPLFRKTSCGVTFAHEEPDYNGHWGVRELCDICPAKQQKICRDAHQKPSSTEFAHLLQKYGYITDFVFDGDHVWTHGLGEERRYHLQHTLAFQTWDVKTPHFQNRHGRSPFSYRISDNEAQKLHDLRTRFQVEVVYGDD